MDLSQRTLSRLGDWPRGMRITLVLICFLLAVFLGYMLLLKPVMLRGNKLKQQKNQLMHDITKQQVIADTLPALRREYQSLYKQTHHQQSLLPPQLDVTDLLNTITLAAKQQHLQITLLKSLRHQTEKPFHRLPIYLEIMGSYRTIVGFLVKAFHSNYLIAMADFKLQTKNRKHQKRLQMIMKFYVYYRGTLEVA